MKHISWIFLAAVLTFGAQDTWAADYSAHTGQSAGAIQAGKSTKRDIRAMCGEPTSSRIVAEGEEWRYSYGNAHSLNLFFDKMGLVKDYRYESSSSPPPPQSGFKPMAGEKPGTVHCDLCPVYCTRTVCTLNGCHDEQYICQWYSCNCGGY